MHVSTKSFWVVVVVVMAEWPSDQVEVTVIEGLILFGGGPVGGGQW